MSGPALRPTYCDDCDHRYVVARNDPPWRWLCLRHKRLDALGFVTRDALTQPPYAACYRVNYGACPLYAPARDAAKDSIHDPNPEMSND